MSTKGKPAVASSGPEKKETSSADASAVAPLPTSESAAPVVPLRVRTLAAALQKAGEVKGALIEEFWRADLQELFRHNGTPWFGSLTVEVKADYFKRDWWRAERACIDDIEAACVEAGLRHSDLAIWEMAFPSVSEEADERLKPYRNKLRDENTALHLRLKAIMERVGRAELDAWMTRFTKPDVLVGDNEAFDLGPVASSLRTDLFVNAPPDFPFIVEQIMPKAPGTLVAMGGVGKTRLMIWFAVQFALGLPIGGRYQIAQPGRVLFLAAEDERAVYERRIFDMGVRFSPGEQKAILDTIKVLDLTDASNTRMVEAGDVGGNLEETWLIAKLITLWHRENVALVVVDPMVYFGAGERYGNDGDAKLLQAEKKLVRGLDSAVCNVHHVSKAVARENIRDAHAGRGGSAGGDNSRFVWQATLVELGKDKREDLPVPVIKLLEVGARVIRVDFHKVSYGPQERDPLYLWDQGHWFEPIKAGGVAKADLLLHEMLRACEIVKAQLALGAYPSVDSLKRLATEDRQGIAQRRIADLLHSALQHGLLQEMPLPEHKRQGAKQKFLALTSKATGLIAERREAYDVDDGDEQRARVREEDSAERDSEPPRSEP
jgi:RecA-family ATPase